MATEENLNAARPVQVGAHSPVPRVSDAVRAIAAEFMARYKGTSEPDEFALAAAEAGLLAALPHLQPQPVASPTAEQIAMKLSLVRFSDEESDRMIELTMREAWPLADAVLNLLNGTGVDSTVNTCPGCGVNVIGHERCGDPTRPGCAS